MKDGSRLHTPAAGRGRHIHDSIVGLHVRRVVESREQGRPSHKTASTNAMVCAVAYSSSRLVAASRSAASTGRKILGGGRIFPACVTGTTSSSTARGIGTKGSSNGDGSSATVASHTSEWSGGKKGGVRIFFESQAMAHRRRQQKLLQQRGKRTDNKGSGDKNAGRRKGERNDEQPQLLKIFRPSSSGEAGGESGKEGGLSVYRPFIFPGDAHRYPFHHTSASRRTTGDDVNAAPLPLLDSSPLLDPARYCKKSALPGGTTTVSGGDAARRLDRGRTRLGEIVRNQLVNLDYGSGSSGRSRKAPGNGNGRSNGTGFVLDGTGVPRALMQGSLDLADELLRSMDGAAEISFGNCYDGSLDFNILRVRSRVGDNDPHPWPFVAENWIQSKPYMESWEHRMQLYLTVMNRISRAFGGMIDPTIEATDSKLISTDLPGPDSDQDEVDVGDKDTNATKLDFDLRSWNAGFMRGLAFPPNMIPDCQLGPLLGRSTGFESRAGYVSPPIVELNQSVGSVACPTHVRITIQGTPSASAAGSRIVSSNRAVVRRKRVSPITLVFDCKFSRGDVSS